MNAKILLKSAIAAFSIAALCFLSACDKNEKTAAQNAQKGAPAAGGAPQSIPVEVAKIEQKDMEITFEYPTQLKSLQSVNIYARVEGTLLEQKFTEGQIVKKGQKLFKIDPARYNANVNVAKAAVNSARANYQAAKRDYDRSKRLFDNNALSPREYEQSLSAYEVAEASILSAQAGLDSALIDLEYTDVLATATGRVGMKNYDIGALVGGASGNSVLTTITQLDPIHAEFSIPSNDYIFMRTLSTDNASVQYIFPNGETYSKIGKIDFIDSVVSPTTSTIKARSIVENPDHLLIPGEFLRIKINGYTAKNVITMPQPALMQMPEGSFCYKLVDGKAELTPIQVGRVVGNEIIVESGLKDGEVVVLSQLQKLRPGAPIISMQDFLKAQGAKANEAQNAPSSEAEKPSEVKEAKVDSIESENKNDKVN